MLREAHSTHCFHTSETAGTVYLAASFIGLSTEGNVQKCRAMLAFDAVTPYITALPAAATCARKTQGRQL